MAAGVREQIAIIPPMHTCTYMSQETKIDIRVS
jgi:hypothetical protein